MTETNSDQKVTLQLYAAFGAALVLSVIPSVLAAIVSLVFFLGVLVAAYILRNGANEGSLIENHMTFVIRTMWIGGLFALITVATGSVYLFYEVDNTPLMPCFDSFINIGMAAQNMGYAELMALFRPCLGEYMQINMYTFIVGTGITAGPVLLYFIIRYARGFSRAVNGYRIANPKNWL